MQEWNDYGDYLHHTNKTENAFSPTLPEMLFDRKKIHKILQNTIRSEAKKIRHIQKLAIIEKSTIFVQI